MQLDRVGQHIETSLLSFVDKFHGNDFGCGQGTLKNNLYTAFNIIDKVNYLCIQMLVLEEESDSRRDVLRQRRVNDKHYVYDHVFAEDSTQVSPSEPIIKSVL